MEQRYALTQLGRLALSVARLERSWSAVPPETQARVLAALDQVSNDYQPRVAERPHVPLIGRLAG